MQIAQFIALILPSYDEILLLSVDRWWKGFQYQVFHCYYGHVHVAQFMITSDISYQNEFSQEPDSVVLIIKKQAPAYC